MRKTHQAVRGRETPNRGTAQGLRSDRASRTRGRRGPVRDDAHRGAFGRARRPEKDEGTDAVRADLASEARPRLLLWSATLGAWLAFLPGCADDPPIEPRLVPIQDENGRITYRYEDELRELEAKARPAPDFVAAREMPNAGGAGRGDDQAYREMVAYRKNEQERIEQEQQERRYQQANQEGDRRLQRERARVEQHGQWERENDLFHQRREQAAQDVAARTKQMVDDQTRWLRMQQRSGMQP